MRYIQKRHTKKKNKRTSKKFQNRFYHLHNNNFFFREGGSDTRRQLLNLVQRLRSCNDVMRPRLRSRGAEYITIAESPVASGHSTLKPIKALFSG